MSYENQLVRRSGGATLLTIGLLAAAVAAPALAEDWTHWRGPLHTGVSAETDLISSWSTEGENLLWRQDFIGRSTPLVFAGRVFIFIKCL